MRKQFLTKPGIVAQDKTEDHLPVAEAEVTDERVKDLASVVADSCDLNFWSMLAVCLRY